LARDTTAFRLLNQYGVPGISGVDTRWLTHKLRDGGTQRCALSTRRNLAEKLLAMAREWPGLDGRDMVKEVTCAEPYHWSGDAGSNGVAAKDVGRMRKAESVSIVAHDLGSRKIFAPPGKLRSGNVTVVPADTTAEDVVAMKPDGVFLSNGPAILRDCIRGGRGERINRERSADLASV